MGILESLQSLPHIFFTEKNICNVEFRGKRVKMLTFKGNFEEFTSDILDDNRFYIIGSVLPISKDKYEFYYGSVISDRINEFRVEDYVKKDKGNLVISYGDLLDSPYENFYIREIIDYISKEMCNLPDEWKKVQEEFGISDVITDILLTHYSKVGDWLRDIPREKKLLLAYIYEQLTTKLLRIENNNWNNYIEIFAYPSIKFLYSNADIDWKTFNYNQYLIYISEIYNSYKEKIGEGFIDSDDFTLTEFNQKLLEKYI